MGVILRKITELGIKQGKKITDIDAYSPLTHDATQFLLNVAKEIIKPF